MNKCEALDFFLSYLFICTTAAGHLGPGPSAAATGTVTGLGRAPWKGRLVLAAPTSPPQLPEAQGLASVLVSAGSPAASEPVPDSPSAPFPGTPGSAAAPGWTVPVAGWSSCGADTSIGDFVGPGGTEGPGEERQPSGGAAPEPSLRAAPACGSVL